MAALRVWFCLVLIFFWFSTSEARPLQSVSVANNDALLEQAREILKARVERKDVMGPPGFTCSGVKEPPVTSFLSTLALRISLACSSNASLFATETECRGRASDVENEKTTRARQNQTLKAAIVEGGNQLLVSSPGETQKAATHIY
ncbi:hypothetical protein Ancab_025543, partial [Ancistrocladus abbreviatus]